MLRVEATKIWVLQADGDPVDQAILATPVTFDKSSFEKYFRFYNWFLALKSEVAELNPDASFEIWHHDLGHKKKISDLLSFIESTTAADRLTSKRIKQFNRPLDQGFANWAEFETYLRKAGLSQYLPRP